MTIISSWNNHFFSLSVYISSARFRESEEDNTKLEPPAMTTTLLLGFGFSRLAILAITWPIWTHRQSIPSGGQAAGGKPYRPLSRRRIG